MRIISFIKLHLKSLSWLSCLAVLPLVGILVATVLVIKYAAHISSFSPGEWVLCYGLASLCMALAILPTTLVAILSGYFLGWYCLFPVAISYLFAAWFGYKITRLVDTDALMAALHKNTKAKNFLTHLVEYKLSVVALARLSPVLPFAWMNAVFGALRFPLGWYLIGSFMGMVPRTLLFIYLGMQVPKLTKDSLSTHTPTEICISLGLLVLAFAGLSYVLKRVWKKAR